MKKILFYGLFLSLFMACNPAANKYKSQMIDNPTTQADKDKNIILQHLIDNKINAEVTPSGIYYVMTNEGTGENPSTSAQVQAHYNGTLLDGTKFDSSYDRGNPLDFRLNGVIKGWQEAIPMLKKGGKGTFYIPSSLAYGQRGSGAKIGPNSVLKFDIELVDFSEPLSPADQLVKDITLIEKYIADKGLQNVQKTNSGIHYVISKEGTGGHPSASDKVTTHYLGTLLDGTKFDSSYDRGEPISFNLNGVVKGWQEAIPLLKKGGKGTFLIPSGLAYGSRQAGPVIKPNSVLAFDIELIDF